MHNFIIEFQDALTPHYCEEIIEKFENSQQDHKLGRTGAGVDKSKKDSFDLYLSHLPNWKKDCKHLNGVILRATAHYAQMFPLFLTGAISPSILDVNNQSKTIEHSELAKLPIPKIQEIANRVFRFDDINLQRYTKAVGGYHHWHSEHYPHPTDKEQRSLHRVLLWLIYLNDIEEGGETEFLYQQTKIKPKQGSLVMAPCGFTHSHRGAIPVSSDKYVLASWVMYKDAVDLYPKA